MKLLKILALLSFLFICVNLFKLNKFLRQQKSDQLKAYKSFVHFSPQNNSIKYPTGFFTLNDSYHIYYQYYLNGTKQQLTSWGHATTQDSEIWKQQPIALQSDSLGYLLSGTVVVDVNNTSGFGTKSNPPIVAIFTQHDSKKQQEGRIDIQCQSIAYSIDGGIKFTKFLYNPVISNPGIKYFRDPRVNWYKQFNKWVMVVASLYKVMFYQSINLKQWKFLSQFINEDNQYGNWQNPDLLYFEHAQNNTAKWALLVSVTSGSPNGGSGTRYFAGNFDGKSFILDPQFKQDLKKNNNYWIDFGRDNYAGVSVTNKSPSQIFQFNVYMSWMSNLDYSDKVPTNQYKISFNLPKVLIMLYVNTTIQKYRCLIFPLVNAEQIANPIQFNNIDVSKQVAVLTKQNIKTDTYLIAFAGKAIKNGRLIFKLFNSQNKEQFLFGFDGDKKMYFVDRRKSGNTNFSDKFASKIQYAPRVGLYNDNTIDCIALYDKQSIELFFDNYENSVLPLYNLQMSQVIFPSKGYNSLNVVCQGCFIQKQKNNDIDERDLEEGYALQFIGYAEYLKN